MRPLFALLLTAASLFPADAPPRKAPEFAIQMPNGHQTLLSQYRGKVVILACVFTTCLHCQHTVGVLSGLQTQLGPRGLQVLGAAFNDNAPMLVQTFTQQFGVNFPMGSADRASVLEFLGLPPMSNFYVPILVFVDRKGMIHNQYIGDSEFLKDQEKNIRELANKLLDEPENRAVSRTMHPKK